MEVVTATREKENVFKELNSSFTACSKSSKRIKLGCSKAVTTKIIEIFSSVSRKHYKICFLF